VLDVPDTQPGRDVIALAERSDLGGMSFGFTVPKGGEEWQGNKRVLRQIALKEISVVSAWPAYPDTEIALRALQRGTEAQRRARALVMAELGAWG
jgi:HK97 family phage prohead protease